MARTYWLDLFTGATWKEFRDAGAEVSGFRKSRWKIVDQIKPGDILLCYLVRVSRFSGALEVKSKAFMDEEPIWKEDLFPCRVGVKPVALLTPETSVPLEELKDKLSVLKTFGTSIKWTGYLRGSPKRWPTSDGEAVVQAVLDAEKNPVKRPVEPEKLLGWPRTLKAKTGSYTVPEPEPVEEEGEPTEHTEIQWLLAELGSKMGLEIWVARNDRGRQYKGNRFTDLPNLKDELPAQFDPAVNQTIQLIDLLWFKGNSIIAAFEIESTTQVYSGLLRLSDMIAMQPHLNIPLYVVAPASRHNKVIAEVNRPTFAQLTPPLSEKCRFISFATLREKVEQVGDLKEFLRPQFMDKISEPCEIPED